MVGGKRESESGKRPPAMSPEARENQLIALAADVVEKRLREGIATGQEIVHFLKLGSPRERLERENLALQNELTGAKVEALASEKRVEALYENAIKAMRRYSGEAPVDEAPQYDD